MPLNYSKWDQLELSDDSDIEGHPNVDKRSLIRWKQRDIHEKREIRKHNIARLQAEIAVNSVLLPRIKEIADTLSNPAPSTPAHVYFNQLAEQLEKSPSTDCPPGNDPSKKEQTYDGMVAILLQRVAQDANGKVKGASESERPEKLGKALAAEMANHVVQLGKTIEKHKKELESEEKEQKKHITSDDLHDGFENKYVPPKPEPPPVPKTKIEKPKTTQVEYEVLNPASASAGSSSAQTTSSTTPDDDDDDSLPELTPSLEQFSRIPVQAYERSFEFIQSHRDVVVPGATDALLVAAFQAQSSNKPKYAKQCVHQSLLLQYCEKLGGDGVRVFFKKMISGDKRAEKVFVDDVENTYAHLVQRVELSREEAEAGGHEQIQLVPENPEQSISFNVPDGPPPGDLVLEGPGTENLDLEEVRKALQLRWDVFTGFPEELQEALKIGTLEAVNKILGDMAVEEAESIVQQLDMAGILSFAEGGIRDETAVGRAAAGLPPKPSE